MKAVACAALHNATRFISGHDARAEEAAMNHGGDAPVITVGLCGDVMTGRGVDQALPHAGDPKLHEPWVRDARGYLRLAAEHSGAFDIPVDYAYIWGDAIEEFERADPDVRVINLETSITRATYRCSLRPVSTAAFWPTITSWTGALPGSRRHWRPWKARASELRAPVGI
jgi:hypothetical protein